MKKKPKGIVISVPSKQCFDIAHGLKTLILSKTLPKLDPPFTVKVYCPLLKSAKGKDMLWINRWRAFDYGSPDSPTYVPLNGRIMCQFTCDKIEHIQLRHLSFSHTNVYCAVGENPDNKWLSHACMKYDDVVYFGKLGDLYGLHISDLKLPEIPIDSEVYQECEAPHPWRYIYD